MAAVNVDGVPAQVCKMTAARQKGFEKLDKEFGDTLEWIEESLSVAKNTLQINDIALLPKTPSAARKSRRRVQQRSSTGVRATRQTLRSTSVLQNTVIEEDDSVADISTDSIVSNNGRRKRTHKGKTTESKSRKVVLQEITNSILEDSVNEAEEHISVKESVSQTQIENKIPNKSSHMSDMDKLAATLNIAQDILDFKVPSMLDKASRKTPDIIKSTTVSAANKKSVESGNTLSHVTISVMNSADKKLNMTPVVVVNSCDRKEKLSESEEESPRRESVKSRRSSTVKKAKLNVARLSTSHRSIRVTAAKPPLTSLAASVIKASKKPSGKSSSETDVVELDDEDIDAIAGTPPPKPLRNTRSKMATGKKAAALVAAIEASSKMKPAAAGEAGRTTRSKARVKKIEKVFLNAGAEKGNKLPPLTPGKQKLGGKIQQLQEKLLQNEAFGLRSSPRNPATLHAESRRRSGKRLNEVAASPQSLRNSQSTTASIIKPPRGGPPARAVTPKRMCKDGKDNSGSGGESNGYDATKAKGLQMSSSSSHLKSVVSTMKKPNNIVTSFVQKNTPKVLSQEEVIELKRRELTEKEKKHEALIKMRYEEQQKKTEETKKMRDERHKQAQTRRMELAEKKQMSAQKPEPTFSRLGNKAEYLPTSEEKMSQNVEEEEEDMQEPILPSATEPTASTHSQDAERRVRTRSSGRNKEEAEAERLRNERLMEERAEEERQEREREREREMREKEKEREQRERERQRVEQERRERIMQENKLKQEEKLQRLKAQKEQLEREQELMRQREAERINREKAEALKIQEAEKNRLDAERKLKEEQARKLQQQREAATKQNPSSAARVPSMSVEQSSKNNKLASAVKPSGAMRVSTNDASAAKPSAAGGPARVMNTGASASSKITSLNESHNTSIKPAKHTAAQQWSKTLNKTFEKESEYESYDMTPAVKKKFAPSTVENYNIDDLNSEDDTDDEEHPRKKIPEWAQGTRLKAALINQCVNNFDGNKLFGTILQPDLNFLFAKKKPRFNKRTSSANWDEFPSFTRP